MNRLNPYKRGMVILLAALILTFFAGIEFKKAHQYDQIIPGPGVVETKYLSDYFADLKGTYADTPIYVLEGEEAGPTVLAIGGTHSREVAGVMSAIMLVENAQVKKGRLLVIPRGNNSGASYTPATEGTPGFYSVENKTGELRKFRVGGRYTNPIHQWPDPDDYFTIYGDYQLEGAESRNLNRCYPGDPEGSYTEKLAYGIMELIQKENVTIAFDFHEAGPNSRLADMLIANPKNLDIGAAAALNLELEDVSMKLEQSSKNFRGLSHREWGDHTDTMAFLAETPNPGQNYRTRVKYEVLATETENPVKDRVGKQLSTFAAVIEAYNMFFPTEMMEVVGIPKYADLHTQGLSPFLN